MQAALRTRSGEKGNGRDRSLRRSFSGEHQARWSRREGHHSCGKKKAAIKSRGGNAELEERRKGRGGKTDIRGQKREGTTFAPQRGDRCSATTNSQSLKNQKEKNSQGPVATRKSISFHFRDLSINGCDEYIGEPKKKNGCQSSGRGCRKRLSRRGNS